MWEKLKAKLRVWLFKGEYEAVARQNSAALARVAEIDMLVQQRVAETLMQMDPFEPLMRQFNGIFSTEYEHPEDKLDAKGQLLLKTLGYQLTEDPSFVYLIDWIMNTQANETLKRAPVTEERVLYGRAQISASVLLKTELNRLSEAYKDMLEANKPDEFDESVTVEE